MEFSSIIRNRESVRKFGTERPTEEQIRQILEAGRLAPTAYNKQPQRFYLLKSEEALDKMDQVHPCRYKAPFVIMVCADKNAASTHNDVSSYVMDGTIAATHMLLAAADVGLDSCWAGISDVAKTRSVFGLPENIYPICFLDLGVRSEDFKGRAGLKVRNPLESMVTVL